MLGYVTNTIPGAIHELDRFHVIKMIRQNVLREEIRKEMLEPFKGR